MKKPLYYPSPNNYTKALLRLQKCIRSGQFTRYTQQKKWQIWNRLCRYARQLGIRIKAPIAAACLAAGLSLVTPASAQTFTQQLSTANPFNGIDAGPGSAPTFVDIDGDGDKDAFVGNQYGNFRYYKNTGTAAAPVFSEQMGVNNPFNGVHVTNYATVSFVDIDGDGDKDAFVGGDYFQPIEYYKNTGTSIAPNFVLQATGTNPLSVVTDYYGVPSFVDIDGDGDMDLFIGTTDGKVLYYKNTGSATVPVFISQTLGANPFTGIDVGEYAVPAFIDLDGDGDKDAFIGSGDGPITYYKNTGTTTAPVFSLQSAGANPLSGAGIISYSFPAFVDIDGDGDMDAFIGAYNGSISYFKNNTIILPLRLLGFSGSRQAGYNQLQWQTAGEINTKQFELEMSSDGLNFIRIATINASANMNHNYSATDKAPYSGKVFYRLRMIDSDGRFTYSKVIWITSGGAGGITIYPNPVTDVLNINIGNAGILKTTAAIFDANGRLRQNILINNNQQQVNVQQFEKGVYVIKFEDGAILNFIKR